MGGRGSSSGISHGSGGLSVTRDGNTTEYYFSSRNGQNYYQKGVGGIPEQTPGNMNMSEFRDRVSSNGAAVKEISPAQRKQREEQRKKDRAQTDKFLNQAYASDPTMSRSSRESRKANREHRRKR